MRATLADRRQIVLVVAIAATVAAGLTLVSVVAADTTSIHVAGSADGDGSVAATPDETVTVTLWANASNVAGYQANLSFDPSVVRVDSVTGTETFADPVATIDNDAGWVDFNQFRDDGRDDPVLATITLTMTGSSGDETALSFQETDTVLANEAGETVTLDEFDGVSVSIESSEPTTTTTQTTTQTTTTTQQPTTVTQTTTQPPMTTTPTQTTTTTQQPTTVTRTTTQTTTRTTTQQPTTVTRTTTQPPPTTQTTTRTTSRPVEDDDDGDGGGDDGGGGGGGGGGGSSAADPPEPSFVVSKSQLASNESRIGETSAVEISVVNEGDGVGEYDAVLYVGEGPVANLTATIAPGETERFTINYSVAEPGTYDVRLNDTTIGSLSIVSTPTTSLSTDASNDTRAETSTPTTTTTTTAAATTGDTLTSEPSSTGGASSVGGSGFGFALAVLAIMLVVASGRWQSK